MKTDSDIDEGFSVLKQFRFWNILYLGNYSVARVIANQCAHWFAISWFFLMFSEFFTAENWGY